MSNYNYQGSLWSNEELSSLDNTSSFVLTVPDWDPAYINMNYSFQPDFDYSNITITDSTHDYSKVKINSKGLELDDEQDVKIGDKSLKTFMDKVEERLAILQPDPKKLEKYEALRKAYEHYKTLEKLIGED